MYGIAGYLSSSARARLVQSIGWFYALPPVIVVTSGTAVALLAYFALPAAIGIPLVALLVLLPWFEERLTPGAE